MNFVGTFTSPVAGLLTIALVTGAMAATAGGNTISAGSSRLHERNGMVVVDNRPFNGHVVERYENGNIKRDSRYRNGKLSGATRGWFPNSKLDYVRTYVDGREYGEHRGWYDDGAKRFEYHFKDGVSNGVSKQWYRNGKPYTVFHFENGQELGAQQMWDTEGKLRANYVVRDGRRYGLPGSVGCRGEL